jgi:hypothetical protein
MESELIDLMYVEGRVGRLTGKHRFEREKCICTGALTVRLLLCFPTVIFLFISLGSFTLAGLIFRGLVS